MRLRAVSLQEPAQQGRILVDELWKEELYQPPAQQSGAVTHCYYQPGAIQRECPVITGVSSDSAAPQTHCGDEELSGLIKRRRAPVGPMMSRCLISPARCISYFMPVATSPSFLQSSATQLFGLLVISRVAAEHPRNAIRSRDVLLI